jgi:hypothetical protein
LQELGNFYVCTAKRNVRVTNKFVFTENLKTEFLLLKEDQQAGKVLCTIANHNSLCNMDVGAIYCSTTRSTRSLGRTDCLLSLHYKWGIGHDEWGKIYCTCMCK